MNNGSIGLRICSSRIILGFGTVIRAFSYSAVAGIKRHQLPPRPKISEDEIDEVFIKGGGRGGQKINKTNSKVQLRHIPTGIVVSSQATRSREQNRAKAREILALKVEELNAPEGTSRLAVVAKYKQNKARKKKSRTKKKYEALAAEKEKERLKMLGLVPEEDEEGDEVEAENGIGEGSEDMGHEMEYETEHDMEQFVVNIKDKEKTD